MSAAEIEAPIRSLKKIMQITGNIQNATENSASIIGSLPSGYPLSAKFKSAFGLFLSLPRADIA